MGSENYFHAWGVGRIMFGMIAKKVGLCYTLENEPGRWKNGSIQRRGIQERASGDFFH